VPVTTSRWRCWPWPAPAARSGSTSWPGTSGYQGLARDFPDQISAPPPKPAKDAPSEQVAAYEQARKQQSSRRICVEHTIAEPKQWRSLQRYIGRREYFDETFQAIAGLVSDRTALR
jgi:hypothetical protein